MLFLSTTTTAAEKRPLLEASAAEGRAALAAATLSGVKPAAQLLVQCHCLQALALEPSR